MEKSTALYDAIFGIFIFVVVLCVALGILSKMNKDE